MSAIMRSRNGVMVVSSRDRSRGRTALPSTKGYQEASGSATAPLSCGGAAPFNPSSLVRFGKRSFLGADLSPDRPTSAAEVKPLPQAAATGGAEPRATHPEKAPQVQGWVSIASGVDGASTLVSCPQIGEGFREFCQS